MNVDNTSAFAALEAMIETIRKLPELIPAAAPAVAEAVERELQRTIAAGTTAYGVPWKPTQDGARPLQHAGEALRVAAVGSVIYVRLTGPEARHHRGIVKGGVARPVIPINKIPGPMATAITSVLADHFQAAAKP